MEWIQRNPKKAIALSALAVLVLAILVWGMTRSGTPSGDPLGGPPLATTTPGDELTALPTPSSTPTSPGDILQALATAGPKGFQTSIDSHGSSQSLPRHHVTVTVHSDGALMAVGWWIPLADGQRKGADTSGSRSFQHSDGTYGTGDLARVLGYGGPYSKKTWCTVTVDGRVTDRQQARGPWAEVFCQG